MDSRLGAYGHAVAASQKILKECDDAVVTMKASQHIRDPVVHDAEVSSVCGAAMVYRRDLFLGVGGFDQSFFVIRKMWIWVFVCGCAGIAVGMFPSPRCIT